MGLKPLLAINYYNLTISGARTTNNVTLASSGTIGVAASFSNTATFTSGGYVVTGSTVDYNGGSQNATGLFTYNNLTFSNSGTKSATVGGITANGTLTIANGVVFSASSFTHTVKGDFTNNGTLSASSSTFSFSGSSAQTIGGSSATTFNNLTINKTANGVQLEGNTTVNGTLTITSKWLTQGLSYNLTAGTISIAAAGVLHNVGTGDLTIGAGGVTNNGIIDFNSSGVSCGQADAIQILSSQAGTQRSWTGSGVFQMVDLYVKDQGGSASIHCYSCTSGGNNDTNWNIDSSCVGAPTAIGLVSFRATGRGGKDVVVVADGAGV